MLTKIHGQPSYQALKLIKDEIKANAAAIYSNLGGAALGHLGLVLTLQEYQHVLAVPYQRHVHPGLLTLPANTTAAQE